MTNLKEINFALFFTRGVSLREWDKIGMLDREIKLYQRLAEKFNKVYLFTYGNKADEGYTSYFPANVSIVTKSKYIPVLFYSFLVPFIHFKKLRDIQIIKTNQMDGSWAAVISKKISKAKLVVRCGYEWLQTIEKAGNGPIKKFVAFCIEKFAYNNADQIILTSEESKDFVSSRFSSNKQKIKIIPNFVDTDLFKPLFVEKEKGRVIFVGRLEKEKNLKNLFTSLIGLGLKLIIIGNGSLKSELQSFSKSIGVEVFFMGNIFQKVLPEELNKSEIFVLPSLYEGNPKVLLEAMACGLACVGANVPGISSVITHDENGLLSSPDPLSLKEAIDKLSKDKELRIRLGKKARESIEKKNNLSFFVEEEISVYKSL